mmetsp:Transcript_72256/g.132268  ORF Transcript_72256/g.132268 Transcript_72256/m.132268 type:complete len:211 (-) Transcript_72256:187-819(-)
MLRGVEWVKLSLQDSLVASGRPHPMNLKLLLKLLQALAPLLNPISCGASYMALILAFSFCCCVIGVSLAGLQDSLLAALPLPLLHFSENRAPAMSALLHASLQLFAAAHSLLPRLRRCPHRREETGHTASCHQGYSLSKFATLSSRILCRSPSQGLGIVPAGACFSEDFDRRSANDRQDDVHLCHDTGGDQSLVELSVHCEIHAGHRLAG